MSSDHRLDVTRQVVREFAQIHTFTRTSWQEYAAELHPELTRAVIPTLLTISHRQPISATDLICVQNSEKSVISKQITLLRSLGLVETCPSETDRRVTLISMTTLGKERINLVRTLLVERHGLKFADWTDQEIETLQSLLHRFNEAQRT